ncbi:MAG: class I SAM-dependent methyltransferase [Thermoanaerobaculia bacterium]
MQNDERRRVSHRMSAATWESLAKKDPWRAVLTSVDGSVAAGDVEARDAFYRSGEAYLERILAAIRAHIGLADHFETAADFGCGVGRVAVPLARLCGELIAVDVSATMLSLTAEHASRQGVGNVVLQKGEDFVADRRGLDLLHSVIVLQHIWPEEGFRILAAVLPRMRPGGVVVLHVPYHVGGERARLPFRWARSRIPGCNAVANMLRGRPAKEPYMQMNAYDLNRLVALLHQHGFGDLFLLDEPQGEVRGVIVIAKR